MEETLNIILLELQQLNKRQQELIEAQKELISRTENIEKEQKKLVTCSKKLNKNHEESITGQQQLRIRIENLERVKDSLSLGQNEIKELIKQSTVYMAGKMSFSERIIMEMDLLNERERQEVLHRINEKAFVRTNNTWAGNWDDDDY